MMIQKLKNIGLLVFLLSLLAACSNSNKEERVPAELLAGEESKVWRAKKETTQSEEESRSLTGIEEDESVEFFRDGTFQISKNQKTITGSWTYKPTERSLELTFDDQPEIIETFYVTQLKEGKLDVRAQDGATLQLSSGD